MNKKLKTNCFYCKNETNQEVLLSEFELNGQELIQRNDEGDESPGGIHQGARWIGVHADSPESRKPIRGAQRAHRKAISQWRPGHAD